ncbi:hypothetical protein BRC68_10475 [Halobacteriales archaeon QH_6_64_20]|nr:MAG: hypothetical protein BRC68_10475 [Halobacteriales archaeon QH_6_64_20]
MTAGTDVTRIPTRYEGYNSLQSMADLFGSSARRRHGRTKPGVHSRRAPAELRTRNDRSSDSRRTIVG